MLPMIDTELKARGLTMDELDVLGVTNGPGSFTGPVSYTHLDVYKRQGMGGAFLCTRRGQAPYKMSFTGAL